MVHTKNRVFILSNLDVKHTHPEFGFASCGLGFASSGSRSSGRRLVVRAADYCFNVPLTCVVAKISSITTGQINGCIGHGDEAKRDQLHIVAGIVCFTLRTTEV